MKENNTRKVQFKLYAPNAKDVYLAGSFNRWSPIKKRLRKNEKGEWITRAVLAEGKYYYKFVVDGEWINDPGASGYEPNGLGTVNSVKIVLKGGQE